ncbi:YqgE/AlgH family protein [Nocardioides montaniterrae]
MTPGLDPAPGLLLVASPELVDPNFADTVVLLLEVNDEGAFGVVLNRPTQIPVDDILAPWGDVVDFPEVLFSGGPVGTDGALAVALDDDADQGGCAGFRAVAGNLGILDLDTPPELVVGAIDRLRVFVGYAGWGAGQLQGEIAREDWYVVPSMYDDVFGPDATGLSRRVLRRQPGELALHATRPADPAMN